jgi:hypothetical protein
MVVRGTKKFLDRVGRATTIETRSSGRLGDWYANPLFWRPQVVLFLNERTRLPVLVPLAPALSVVDRFPTEFARVASRLGLTVAAVTAEVEAMTDWVLAKTSSRSLLGTMNEFAHLADNYRWRHDTIDLVDLSLWLAEVPVRPLFDGEGSPDRELRAVLVQP